MTRQSEENFKIKKFTEENIERITGNYSTPIGKGGFGEVYRGIHDEYDLVAVKRYIHGDLREEFMEEVSIHSKINHKNVVKLIGYCIGESLLTLVTEYISKGSLDEILHNTDISIPLDVRLGIAIGCAEALSYMHSMHLSSDSLVCHGDIKPANILLDENLTAKVSDFGLSRLLSGGITRYTSHIRGSIDYMDPIYLRDGCLTPRSDVYSFGAVLLELIARKRVKEGNISLIGTFCKAFAKRKGLKKLFDIEVANVSNENILEELARLATDCLRLDIDKRPKMNDVVGRLRMIWKDLRGGGKFSDAEVQNYSHRLSWSSEVYKGTLEDNTVVAVKKCVGLLGDWKEFFISGQMVQSQMLHKNIVKLLCCCLEGDNPIFVYEYANKGSLYNIMDGKKDFPLDLRMKIAIKMAEVLEYLHSSETGIIRHGQVVPSNILLDDNFMPKLTGFSGARRLINGSENTASDREQPACVMLVKSDVYDFGILLLALISRKYCDLVAQFSEAYNTENSGKELFDKDITAEEDITVLEEIGRLALKCTHVKEDERPAMKEVAECLRMIRRSWKKCMAQG
ncbi:unnamed protein product [Urochloa decumbens]|uniref:Protein kinase domain-containing protein n=1 Tax=Urochloa decumbens TaxID=240449 RepID=A0ABC9B4U2_9POAL